jgi:hypothetical protein
MGESAAIDAAINLCRCESCIVPLTSEVQLIVALSPKAMEAAARKQIISKSGTHSIQQSAMGSLTKKLIIKLASD